MIRIFVDVTLLQMHSQRTQYLYTLMRFRPTKKETNHHESTHADYYRQ